MRKTLYIIILLVLAQIQPKGQESEFGQIYEHFKDQSTEQLINLGKAFSLRNENDSALICFTIAANRYNENLDSKEKGFCSEAYNQLGIIYFLRSNFPKAYSNFLKALEAGSEQTSLHVYGNIAGVYHYYNDFAKTAEFLDKAYDRCLQNHDFNNLVITWHNILNQYYSADSLPALRDRIDAFAHIDIPSSHLRDYVILENSAMSHILENQPALSIQAFKASIRIADSLWLSERLAVSSLTNIALTFKHQKEYDSAIAYLKQAESLSLAHPELTMDICKLLEECYQQKGDKENAVQYRTKYTDIRDSIFNTQNLGKIKDLQSFFELEKIESQVHALIQEKKQRNILLYVVCTALTIISAFVFLLARKNRTLLEANRSLYRKNVEIIENEAVQKKNRNESESRLKKQAEQIENLQKEVSRYAGAKTSKAEAESGRNTDEAKEAQVSMENTPRHDAFPGNNPASSQPIGEPTAMHPAKEEPPAANNTRPKLSQERRQALLDNILNVMEKPEDFCSTEFSLEKLAELADSNSKYVSMVINEDLGKNFSNFLNEYRIKEACKRIMDTRNYGQFTYEAIGLSVGFKSRSNFSHTFKKITGLTIKEFKKMSLDSSLSAQQDVA